MIYTQLMCSFSTGMLLKLKKCTANGYRILRHQND